VILCLIGGAVDYFGKLGIIFKTRESNNDDNEQSNASNNDKKNTNNKKQPTTSDQKNNIPNAAAKISPAHQVTNAAQTKNELPAAVKMMIDNQAPTASRVLTEENEVTTTHHVTNAVHIKNELPAALKLMMENQAPTASRVVTEENELPTAHQVSNAAQIKNELPAFLKTMIENQVPTASSVIPQAVNDKVENAVYAIYNDNAEVSVEKKEYNPYITVKEENEVSEIPITNPKAHCEKSTNPTLENHAKIIPPEIDDEEKTPSREENEEDTPTREEDEEDTPTREDNESTPTDEHMVPNQMNYPHAYNEDGNQFVNGPFETAVNSGVPPV